jgi:hypothetical protein
VASSLFLGAGIALDDGVEDGRCSMPALPAWMMSPPAANEVHDFVGHLLGMAQQVDFIDNRNDFQISATAR